MKNPDMEKPSYGCNDPIAAPATTLGESALALIRISGVNHDGQNAIDLLARFFSRPEALVSAGRNSIVHGWIQDASGGEKEKIDEVLISVYRAPHSYTGEDAADISCHGSIAVVKTVMAILKKAGFREALPGEFTFRAFMNGKLDLTRAESVMELVAAKTGRAREQAVRRLMGELEKELSGIKALLVDLLAGIEIYLDYSEDEFLASNDETEGRLPGRNLAEEAVKRLKSLLDNWRRERIYAEGAMAVITGRPNAGKSSLFNYLVREDRSIVTDTPGTTRDWIEALISVEDIPLRLADTAGLRDLDTPNHKEGEEAERIGVERSFELLDRADLVLYVIDGAKGFTKEDRIFLSKHKEVTAAKPILIIWNKADLVKSPVLPSEELPGQFLTVSAKTGDGIPSLLLSMAGLLAEDSPAHSQDVMRYDTAGPGSRRQKELIDLALDSVEEALVLADRKEPLDIIAPLIRSAIASLGEITGEVSNADILEAMFSRFCVGK